MSEASLNANSFYKFNYEDLSVVAGGRSIIDQPKLHIYSLEDADAFFRSYGFDLKKEEDLDRAWQIHRRAIVLMVEKLKFAENEIPEEVRLPDHLKDIRNLLIWASSDSNPNLHRWACAVLRCMHVFSILEADLFAKFADQIQMQILAPFENAIVHEDQIYLRSHQKEGLPQIPLYAFHTKPLKSSSSSVIKLLSKPNVFSAQLLDKVGVRFVTNSIFDCFQVIRFLMDENVINYAHIMPDQSSNNLYPVDEFIDVCNKLEKKYGNEKLDPEVIERFFTSHFNSKKQRGILNLFRKQNPFSSTDFKYIKFICRKLINIKPDSSGDSFNIFFPYEVQILDKGSYMTMQGGTSEHTAYKVRQVEAARKRVYPL